MTRIEELKAKVDRDELDTESMRLIRAVYDEYDAIIARKDAALREIGPAIAAALASHAAGFMLSGEAINALRQAQRTARSALTPAETGETK